MDHTECIMIEFDTSKIEYEELLFEWSQLHSPFSESLSGRQYMSMVIFVNPTQKEICTTFLESLSKTKLTSIKTEAQDFSNKTETDVFYKAEEYHQHYLAKEEGLGMS